MPPPNEFERDATLVNRASEIDRDIEDGLEGTTINNKKTEGQDIIEDKEKRMS